MQGTERPSRAPLTLFTLNSPDAIKEYAIGCDADVGGTSTAFFDYDADPAHAPPGKPGAARFHGVMRLAVRPGYEQLIRGGYAGFRNKVAFRRTRTRHLCTLTLGFRTQFRSTLFGEFTDDVSNHRFLALRVRAAGHPRTRGSYFVNVQTEGPTNDDLWQHRLYFAREDGGWEDVFVRSVSLMVSVPRATDRRPCTDPLRRIRHD
jgi:NADH dehydrogenase [ubiquinone] 1 alpha subcomplex assembly factor 1